MKKIAIAALLLCSIAGCKKKQPAPSAAPATALAGATAPTQTPVTAPTPTASGSEIHPTLKGISYQLLLKGGTLSFCDDGGPQTIDLASGKQSAGTQTCDRKNEQLQSRCDDNAITSASDGPNDTIDLGKNTYRLTGHARDCDQEGNTAIVSTGGDVEVIDFDANKVAILDATTPDKVVIGSGWVAWNALGKPPILTVMPVAKAMEHATTPKQ